MYGYSILTSLLAFVSVICLGGALLTSISARRKAVRGRLLAPGEAVGYTDDSGDKLTLVNTVAKIGSMVSSKGTSSGLRRQMTKAGFLDRRAVTIFLGAKMFLLVAGLIVLGILATFIEAPVALKMLFVMGGATVLFFVPNIFVQLRCRNRCAEVRRHLPAMIDLLEICVSGGMGLDMAWNSVADEIRPVSPLLADEMALTNLETHLGADRAVAVRNMAERTGADELSRLVAVLVQTQRFGTSVSEALRIFASSMRELRSQRAEESAETMSVKMLFPMILFIFPVVLVVAVGPACITLYQVFSGD
jgi:tight adherence protein C